jgi:hypothetical protein
MRRVPARRGALSVVVSVLGLGGCSSSAGSRSNASPSPTSTVAAGDHAAIAAVLAQRDGWNKSVAGEGSIAFRKTFSGKCSVCNGNAETLDRYFGDRNRIRGERYGVRSLKVSQHRSTTIVVDGVLSMSSSKIYSDKTVVDRKKDFTDRISWKVGREDGRWLVANLGETL